MFPFLAIDFETTGSVPGFRNEPWQLGAILMPESGGLPAAQMLDSLLRISPDRPFNRYTPGRHAQLRQQLACAPTLSDLWPVLAPHLASLPVIAHNIGTERTQLRSVAPLHTKILWIDTLALARLAWPSLPSYALEELIPALGLQLGLETILPGRAPHDALYDAAACALLFEHLLLRPAWTHLSPQDLSVLCRRNRK
ncbi:MAG: exonuclease domain-containing protein [Kiritimatiellia bacterium]